MAFSVLSQFGTTLLILFWSLLLSFLMLVFAYEIRRSRILDSLSGGSPGGQTPTARLVSKKSIENPSFLLLLPAIMFVPILIWGMRSAFGLNIIFPPDLDSSRFDIFVHTLLPAIALLFGAGVISTMGSLLNSEIGNWIHKPFTRFSLSLGKDIHRELRFIVMIRTYTELWSRSLPWYFGELIVVEALFNAPGLGFSLWDSARRHDYPSAASGIAVILFIYYFSITLNRTLSRWVGEKLESYG